MDAAALGNRIQVVGPSCSGKSTLAADLAERLGARFIELDALYWRPAWASPPDDEFDESLREATATERFVVAGNYSRHTIPLYWQRLDTVVWLDFPERVVFPRILTRSWRRWRNNEHLWGTNYERFWSQLKVWDQKDSLIAYGLRNRAHMRQRFLDAMASPDLRHIQWVRLKSPAQVRGWLESVDAPNPGPSGGTAGSDIEPVPGEK